MSGILYNGEIEIADNCFLLLLTKHRIRNTELSLFSFFSPAAAAASMIKGRAPVRFIDGSECTRGMEVGNESGECGRIIITG